MKCKKMITIIIAAMLILLPMITTPVQAAVGKVYNLSVNQSENGMLFSWSEVSEADGYNIYINTSNKGYKMIGSVQSTKVSIIGFKNTETYKVKICAYELKNNQKNEGTFSEEVTVSLLTIDPETSLEKVNNLKVSQSGDYIKLNWSEVSKATGYEIDIRIPGFDYMNIGTALSNNIFVRGGKAGQTYEIRVRAYLEGNGTKKYGEYSTSSAITLKSENTNENEKEEITLNKVSGISVSNVTTSSAYVKWNSTNNATGYEVWIAKGNEKYSKITNTIKTNTTISNLNSDTKYKVIIVAFNNEGASTIYAPDSSSVSFTTKEVEKPTKVKNLTTTVKNKNSVKISWKKVPNASGYEIHIAEDSDSFEYEKSTASTSCTINDLEYDTKYRVKVCAYKYVDGEKVLGDYSAIKTFYTEEDELEKVKGLTAKVENKNDVYLEWNENDDAYGYEIWISKSGGTYSKKATTTKCEYTLENLAYSTSYKVKVRAYDYVSGKKTYGDFSAVKTVTTAKKNTSTSATTLGRVKNVDSDVVNKRVTLTWNKVSGADGYHIQFSAPSIGEVINLYSTTNSRRIAGLTYGRNYTAKIRAYKIVNGQYVYGEYSTLEKFVGQ